MSFNLNLHTKTLLKNYLEVFPNERNDFSILEKQLNNEENLWTRKNFNWHLTASAYILSSDKKEFILIHNINLDIWLAPGWHREEDDEEMYNNAKREACEETWLLDLELFDWHKENNFIPIDIDSHYIPENIKKWELEHYHHDFRYIFILWDNNNDVKIQLEEVHWFKWLQIKNDIPNYSWNNVLEKIRTVI